MDIVQLPITPTIAMTIITRHAHRRHTTLYPTCRQPSFHSLTSLRASGTAPMAASSRNIIDCALNSLVDTSCKKEHQKTAELVASVPLDRCSTAPRLQPGVGLRQGRGKQLDAADQESCEIESQHSPGPLVLAPFRKISQAINRSTNHQHIHLAAAVLSLFLFLIYYYFPLGCNLI